MMTVHCQGLGIEGDESCGREASVAVRLKFLDREFPWAPVCSIHGLDVMQNMAMAMAAQDTRYDFDWVPIGEMPDLEERPIVDPEFLAITRAETPDNPAEVEEAIEVSGAHLLARMIRQKIAERNSRSSLN